MLLLFLINSDKSVENAAYLFDTCNEFTLPAGDYMFQVNNRNTRIKCKICSKLTIKTPERRQWRHSSVFIVNLEHVSHHVIAFLLLDLNL